MGRRLLVAVLVVLVALAAAKKMKRKNKKAMMGAEIEELKEKMAKMWEKVKDAGPPVHVHMHGGGDVMEDHMKGPDGTHVHIHLDSGDATLGQELENLLEDDGYYHAQCNIHPYSGSSNSVKGAIYFKQKARGPLQMKISLEGFNVSGPSPAHQHGFHLHQYGDLSGGCGTLGGHFNPHGTSHGGLDHAQGQRHAGDWGNIQCDGQGRVEEYRQDSHTSLLGRHSIVGRGVVIHEGTDDLGLGGRPDSHATGAAGGRLACCVVTWHPEASWEMPEGVGEVKSTYPHSHDHGHHKKSRDHHRHGHRHARDLSHFEGDGHHHDHHHDHDHAPGYFHGDGHHHHEHHDHHRHRRDVHHHHHDHDHHDHAHAPGHFEGDGHSHHDHHDHDHHRHRRDVHHHHHDHDHHHDHAHAPGHFEGDGHSHHDHHDHHDHHSHV